MINSALSKISVGQTSLTYEHFPNLSNFKLCSSRLKRFTKNKYAMTLLQRAPNSSLREGKRKQTKVVEEHGWATAQVVVGRSCCGRSDSGVLGFGFELESLVYTYTFDYLRAQLQLETDLPERSHRISRRNCLYYLK